MSTREYAHIILDKLTDEELEEFIMQYQDLAGFNPPNSVDSVEEIDALLAEAEEDVKNGEVYPWEEVKSELRERYGL